MNILVINCGSSSIKYKLFQVERGNLILSGKVERVGEQGQSYRDALQGILDDAEEHQVDAVGHRVVHGGERFVDATLIDDEVIAAIEGCVPLAPLHNPANLAGIRAARAVLPDLPHVAVFDTAFHSTMTGRARNYALDEKVAKEQCIRRYGFHGTSHSYVARRASELLERDLRELRLVTCHLGNGASCCAVEFGYSVETSMGMTPLEGLVMGTRSGDVDPGVVLQLARTLGIDATDELLNKESGLLGLSGVSHDLRDIEQAAEDGNERCRRAINVFAHQVRKYIGAYAAVMGGVDAVVMTGGIGENSSTMRRRILQRLDFLGLRLDEYENQKAKLDAKNDGVFVSAGHSGVAALVIATNEELEIARQAASIIEREAAQPGPIPIAISARHVHLDRATMDILFGEGSELEVHKEISQPGQFASKQKVDLIGPRSRIDGVRVLGPLRSKNQIEVSRTDEFKLGIDAPIRRSGQVEGSAPIILQGPKGAVPLHEGLICARRHIHMTPEDATAYGVHDGDEVEVKISGGPRDLTFGDVLVRVKSSYKLEMHIDTDEANAAELSRGAEGDLVYCPPAGEVLATVRKRQVRRC